MKELTSLDVFGPDPVLRYKDRDHFLRNTVELPISKLKLGDNPFIEREKAVELKRFGQVVNYAYFGILAPYHADFLRGPFSDGSYITSNGNKRAILSYLMSGDDAKVLAWNDDNQFMKGRMTNSSEPNEGKSIGEIVQEFPEIKEYTNNVLDKLDRITNFKKSKWKSMLFPRPSLGDLEFYHTSLEPIMYGYRVSLD